MAATAQAMYASPMLNLKSGESATYHVGDGGSTQVGTGSGTGKPADTSAGIATCDEIPHPFECSSSNRCALDLDDLNSFKIRLQRPLLTAYPALHATDADLHLALSKILKQVAELTESSTGVVKNHGAWAHRFLYDVLPSLTQSIQEGSDHMDVSNLQFMQTLITRMKHDATLLRGNYLNIVEANQYLITCTQLALDFYEMSDAPQDLEDLAWAPGNLRAALVELKNTHMILADPSDFWLIFHVAELELGRIEKASRQFASLQAGERLHVCQALEMICLQYLMPQTQWPEPCSQVQYQ